VAAVLTFTVAALAPFAFYAARSPEGVEHIFRYLADRPLQLEAVLGTPLLVARVFHLNHATVGFAFGSNSILAPGAGALATLSGPLTALALIVTYALIWRRRATIVSGRREHLPLAMLGIVLAIMVFGKVLSPQFMIWLLPLLALVATTDVLVRWLGLLMLALTQLGYPSFYGALVKLRPEAVAILTARNLLLAALLAVVLWRLATLPATTETTAEGDASLAGEVDPDSNGYTDHTALTVKGTDQTFLADR